MEVWLSGCVRGEGGIEREVARGVCVQEQERTSLFSTYVRSTRSTECLLVRPHDRQLKLLSK